MQKVLKVMVELDSPKIWNQLIKPFSLIFKLSLKEISFLAQQRIVLAGLASKLQAGLKKGFCEAEGENLILQKILKKFNSKDCRWLLDVSRARIE